jgi:uncharacterized protein
VRPSVFQVDIEPQDRRVPKVIAPLATSQEETSMRLSPQIYVMELASGWRGLYSPFGHHVAFLFEEAWEKVRKGEFDAVDGKITAYLRERNFVVPDGFEERWRTEQNVSSSVQLNSMYLVTTGQCNFGCKYCAVIENVDSEARMRERMSIDVGMSAMALFERHLNKTRPSEARVTFYGGEPMLNQPLIFALVPLIRRIRYEGQRKPVDVVMISNGYVYNPEITRLFKDHQAGVCISLDGTRRHQDVTRRTRGGWKSTFDRVIANFRRYQAAGLSMGISTALGRHNVFDLGEIAEFFGSELRAPFVEFQVPYQVSEESNEFWISTREVGPALMDAYAILGRHGVIEGTTYRRLRDFALGRIRWKDCSASGGQLVVAPDGSIGPCHSLVGSRTFFGGNVADPECDPAEMEDFQEWARRFPLNMPMCHGCPFISLCGGGCIYNSFVSTGTIWEKDPQACPYMEEMVRWILKDLWRETGMASQYGESLPAASYPSCRGVQP